MTRSLRSALGTCILCIAATACTATHITCPADNWRDIGFAAGAIGKTEDRFEHYSELCAAKAPEADREAWLTGYREGLASYCSMETAYAKGFDGSFSYRLSVCPADRQQALHDEYIRGAKCENVNQRPTRFEDDDDDDIHDPDYDPERELAYKIGEIVADAIVNELFDLKAEWDRLECY